MWQPIKSLKPLRFGATAADRNESPRRPHTLKNQSAKKTLQAFYTWRINRLWSDSEEDDRPRTANNKASSQDNSSTMARSQVSLSVSSVSLPIQDHCSKCLDKNVDRLDEWRRRTVDRIDTAKKTIWRRPWECRTCIKDYPASVDQQWRSSARRRTRRRRDPCVGSRRIESMVCKIESVRGSKASGLLLREHEECKSLPEIGDDSRFWEQA